VENTETGMVRFSVEDKGSGIDTNQLPKLFGLFQQLDSSDSRPKGGTGLGLAISKAIVEQHGGKIGVESSPGQGSTFWFEVPYAMPERLMQKLQHESMFLSKKVRAVHKILLVEDDHHLRTILAEALASEGFNVTGVSSLKEATEYLSIPNIPDIVLLDIQLPDGNGLGLLQSLRENSATQDVPVVVITGSDQSSGEYADPFLIDWIKKPFDITRLLNALKLATKNRPPGRARVLVVDDDVPTRELIRQQIGSFDIEYIEAADGIDAVHLARTKKPDLIILDLAIPSPDGFEVVEILRREKNQSTSLLVYTARDLSNDDKEKLKLGLSAYLTKSRTSEEQFINAVKTLLNGLIAVPKETEPPKVSNISYSNSS